MANVYEQDSTKLDQPWMRINSTLLPRPWRGSVRREPETKMTGEKIIRVMYIGAFILFAFGGFLVAQPTCPPRSVALFQIRWYCLATVEPRR